MDEIYVYTLTHWGKAQAEGYLKNLDSDLPRLASNEKTGYKVQGDLEMEYCRSQKHYIFYIREANSIFVLGVLHERMDMIKRIKERLDDPNTSYH